MAALPPPSQVAGSHIDLYEAYYQQVDGTKRGTIPALDAAAFLKKSGLSDAVLSKVWDLSDPTGRGFLDKPSFYVALKLVSLAQSGKDVSIANATMESPAPNMGDKPNIANATTDWTIKPAEKVKFEQLFDSLGPINGRLPGSKVKPIMLNSKLPVDALGRVWDLSDMDGDGFLDKDEFVVAMHLIYKALENQPVPTVLPPDLVPASKKKKKILAGSVAVLPALPTLPPGTDGAWNSPLPNKIDGPEPAPTNATVAASTSDTIPWVVTSVDKARFDVMFKTADLDADGYVNGTEIKDLFLQSGLPQPVLAHIWNLCDVKQTGKLNMEQFALAMFLVQQKLLGVEPPSSLPPEMVPPSLRPKPVSESNGMDPASSTAGSAYSNPELEMISKEIDELTKEKQQIEQEVTQKEADIRLKKGEIRLLQNELETLTAAIKQLETQKGEAQKRLDDLDLQKTTVEQTLSDLRQQVDEETQEVNKLKETLNDQEKSLKDQETELNAKRQELNELRQEENKLEQKIESGKNQLNTLCKTLEDTQLQITQAKTKITQLQDQQKQVTDAITQYESAVSSGDISEMNDIALRNITPVFQEPDYQKLGNTSAGSSVTSLRSISLTEAAVIDEIQEDPFKSKDPFSNINGFVHDPFAGDDPFKNDDPFKADPITAPVEDPFRGSDPFAEAFGRTVNDDDAFKSSGDPFSAFPAKPASAKNDPFDPFGIAASDSRKGSIVDTSTNGDPFGSDPFAPSAATRSESPTPALPPKKSKQPPPRPAPPKSSGVRLPRAAPPAPDPFTNGSTTTNNAANDLFAAAFESEPFDPFTGPTGKIDPFANTTAGSDQFADFANFDKFSDWPPASEEEQLAWATKESLRLEQDRQKEDADFELAIALSRVDTKKEQG